MTHCLLQQTKGPLQCWSPNELPDRRRKCHSYGSCPTVLNMHFPSLSFFPSKLRRTQTATVSLAISNLDWIRSIGSRLLIVLLLCAAHDLPYNVDACVHMMEISKTKRWVWSGMIIFIVDFDKTYLRRKYDSRIQSNLGHFGATLRWQTHKLTGRGFSVSWPHIIAFRRNFTQNRKNRLEMTGTLMDCMLAWSLEMPPLPPLPNP